MKETLNATCSICGKRYHVCATCSDTKNFTPWRTITDTINCYKIFIIIRDYTNGYKSKEDTKVELEKCDLTEVDLFTEEVSKVIKELLKTDKRTKKVSDEKENEE